MDRIQQVDPARTGNCQVQKTFDYVELRYSRFVFQQILDDFLSGLFR